MNDAWHEKGDTPTSATGLAQVPQQAEAAARALEALKGPAQASADAISEAFGRAGDSLAGSLTRAALDGEISLQELARAVLAVVNTLGSSNGKGGLGAALSQALSAVCLGGFAGARADGGPVLGGQSYLVGERGPEVFRPAGAGQIEPLTGPAPSVVMNVTVQGGPEALLRSEAQIARMLARAAAAGMRRGP